LILNKYEKNKDFLLNRRFVRYILKEKTISMTHIILKCKRKVLVKFLKNVF
jgi:hypothetical protein